MNHTSARMIALVNSVNQRGIATYSDVEGDMAQFHIKQLNVYLARAVNQGLLRAVRSGRNNFYTVTEKGMDVIQAKPEPVKPVKPKPVKPPPVRKTKPRDGVNVSWLGAL